MYRYPKISVVCLGLLLGACAHQPLSWERTAYAARHAATHPSVWAPVLGASVLMIDNLDNRIAEDLVDETPVFGSVGDASDASDDLESLLTATALISALTVPVPEGDSALEHRANHLAVTFAGLELTGGITDILKTLSAGSAPTKVTTKVFRPGTHRNPLRRRLLLPPISIGAGVTAAPRNGPTPVCTPPRA